MTTSADAATPHSKLTGKFAFLSRFPLRWRLLSVALGLICIALALTLVVTGALINRYLLGQAEQELRLYASAAATQQLALAREGDSIPTGFAIRVNQIAPKKQIELANPVTESARPAIPYLSVTDPRIVHQEIFTVGSTEPGQTEWLALGLVATSDNGSAVLGTVVVALPLRPLDQTVDQLLLYAALIGALVLIACAVLGWFLVRRAFRPLSRIEETTAEIAAGDLTRRIDDPDSHDEVASLSRSLNAMLAQLEVAFAQREAKEETMRRFVADASHELRTPLAAVSGYAQLYRQGALPTADAVGGAMSRIEGESARMSRLVDDLLTLARMDEERPLELQDIDLAVLAADAAQDARTIEPERPIVVSGSDGTIRPTTVSADDQQMRQVITNLLTNARVHTPAETPIELLVGFRDAETATIVVRDHGPGIPEDERDSVFGRFFRTDASRSRARGGNGLGLAIVAAIVHAHGGKCGVVETPGGGATFIVDLPRQRSTGNSKVTHTVA